jgi:hypothetical protein
MAHQQVRLEKADLKSEAAKAKYCYQAATAAGSLFFDNQVFLGNPDPVHCSTHKADTHHYLHALGLWQGDGRIFEFLEPLRVNLAHPAVASLFYDQILYQDPSHGLRLIVIATHRTGALAIAKLNLDPGRLIFVLPPGRHTRYSVGIRVLAPV